MNKWIFLFACILFCSSCKDDDELLNACELSLPVKTKICEHAIDDFTTAAENKDSTINFDNCLGGFENYINVEPYSYSYPCFNPNNANEIAYLRKDNNEWTGCNFEIWIFNFCTGKTRFVTDGICYSIDWSVKDWIVFTGEDRQLWKVKSDGDSLTQLTTSGSFNNNAIWNSDGTKLIYKKNGSSIASSFFLTIDETGKAIDTIPELIYVSSWHWSSDNEFISCISSNAMNEVVLAFYNINTRQFSEMPPLDVPQYGYIMDTDWITEDISVWGTYQLIGTTDIVTNESKEIAKGYQNRFYDNLAAAPDGASIVVEREDMFQTGDCDIETRRNLYIMNADGSNERRINIPE
ncbi:MAG: hypothetical protein ACI9N1_000352 [Flavobacteriales bacterium]|jgi:hypothetical protein